MKIFISQDGKTQIPSGNVGISLSDAEFCADGGLFAECLENRGFEKIDKSGFVAYPEECDTELRMKTDRPLFPETPNYLRLSVSAGGRGIKNTAHGGISITAGVKYELSFYLRSYDFRGTVTAGVQNGQTSFEKKFKVKPDGKWHRFVFRKKAKRDIKNGEFVLTLSAAGKVHLDWFSFAPTNAIKGLFRRDLSELMKDFKPGFIRYFGGMELKDSLAKPEHRKRNLCGMGFYEFFLFCEYLCAKPVPVLNFPDFDEESMQSILDLIEFAVGESDSEWGSVREELGHEEPFALETLGLLPTDAAADQRALLDAFAERIHQKYPHIRLIVPADGSESTFDHFYARDELLIKEPKWFYENVNRYDGFPRSRKVAVNFAARGETPLEGALAEAAFMCGLEQNAGVAVMYSHASLISDENARNAVKAYDGTPVELPSLQIQKIFSLYTGNFALKTKVEGVENVFASASEREGLTYVKIVNAGEETLDAELEGDFEIGELTRIIRMERNPETGRVVPSEVAPYAARTLSLSPHSFSLLVLRR